MPTPGPVSGACWPVSDNARSYCPPCARALDRYTRTPNRGDMCPGCDAVYGPTNERDGNGYPVWAWDWPRGLSAMAMAIAEHQGD